MSSKVSSAESAQLLCQSCPKQKHSNPGNFSSLFMETLFTKVKLRETISDSTASNWFHLCLFSWDSEYSGTELLPPGMVQIPQVGRSRKFQATQQKTLTSSSLFPPSLRPWPDTSGSPCCGSPRCGPHSQPPRTGSRSGGRMGRYSCKSHS